MTISHTLSRRRFLQTTAAGAGALVIGFQLPTGGRYADAAPAQGPELVNAWLRIDPDNTVTIMVPSSEMGQGVYTAMPMLVAEELEVDWRSVRAEMAPVGPQYVNLIFGMQATGGSTSIRWSHKKLREVGAQAREVLRQAAANRWQVPITECHAGHGHIVHSDGRKLSYGELAMAAAKLKLPQNVALKPPARWTILGKPEPRLDIPAKVTGKAGFGIDTERDGMLVATVMACPAFGGTLKAVDESAAHQIKGVKQVVKLKDAVAVVADGYWPAKKALDTLKPQWNRGANATNDSDHISHLLHQALESDKPATARDDGDTGTALANADQTLEAIYEVPPLAHATMEPMNGTAYVTKDGAEFWLPTQSPGMVPVVLGKILGLKPDQIKVHTTFLGGGFGRRFEMDFAIQAALIAKAAGVPVKLIWSREEDMRHDFYRPASVVHFQGGIQADGSLKVLSARIACPSIFARVNPKWIKHGVDSSAVEGISDSPYSPPNMRVEYVQQEIGVPVGFWRSVGNSQNGFFMECFIDELANAAGSDPFDFRRSLLQGKTRELKVLDRLANLSSWGNSDEGIYQGVALHKSFDTIVGQVAEISMPASDKIKLHRITCVVDCGTTVNPDTIEAQVESSIVYGLTAAFFGRISVTRGAVEQANFDTYPMIKLAQMPAIQVDIIADGGTLGGMGEPALPPATPAVLNAYYAANGQRIRSLPLSQNGIQLA